MRRLSEVAWVLGYEPAALEAAPFWAVAKVQEGVPAAAAAGCEPEARPAARRPNISEFVHRFYLLLLCFRETRVEVKN